MSAKEDGSPCNVEKAKYLIQETRKAIERADKFLADLANAPSSILGEMAETTCRIRERLLADLEELKALANKI
jgi:hypothetical protein